MKLLSIKTRVMYDPDPDPSYLEQKGFEDRLRQYKNGVFGFVGVDAIAEIVDSNDTVQIVISGGIWGIEDDAQDIIDDYKKEELDALYDTLDRDYGMIRSEVEKFIVGEE
jgi:hypothetical protein